MPPVYVVARYPALLRVRAKKLCDLGVRWRLLVVELSVRGDSMPELPEVEIMARNLHRWMVGRCLVRMEVLDDKFDVSSLQEVEGDEVTRVYRRAKYAVIEFAGGHCQVLHYRMTGKTIQDPDAMRRARLRWVFRDAPAVAFEDPRRFGTCERVREADLAAYFQDKNLGPEPWPVARDAEWWKGQMSGLRGPIKPALMRQDRVAGLGNIAASEILFRARIHPVRTVPSLVEDEWAQIARAVPEFIAHTLHEESGDEIQYVNMGGEGSFSVYGHDGETCLCCSQRIVRLVQSGRGTFFCPGCQSL